jgi:peptidoglycan/xylan/chitin deacetylase (PgdA/CDA1 family)
MSFYFYKTPAWLRWCYPKRIWQIETIEPVLYLTFDDGPHHTATPFVLDTLARYNAKATFFCIGKNVERYPDLYQRLREEGHQVGNHTHHHVNGWKTSVDSYLAEIEKASQYITSSLFRPPYGRITSKQAAALSQKNRGEYKIVMWDLLSGDFDTRLSGEDCLSICKKRLSPGSIIVMHDSEKAWPRLSVMLPQLIEYAIGRGYNFKIIE